ncbi:MAG: hypothetical protein HY343_05170 [Lentisphaerae bacterium]|nr:hypothetical protein [Lentisphaerota bacterium]
MKIVGKYREALGRDPLDNVRRAAVLQMTVEQLNPYPRPRGFVFKARTWKAYRAWRARQANPRLW